MSSAAPPRAVPVRAGSGGYEVLVGPGAARLLPGLLGERAPAHRYAIVSDDRVAPLHAERLTEACRAGGLSVTLLTFPAGEASKTRESWSRLTDALLDAGYSRDTCLVAVGGGVTTDLAGFVAATFMRGVPVVQVPTSYLAMIDAAVGGKTGVDVRHGKNLVGAFHPPALVVADPELLSTLPRAERAQGLVEAFKHGAILDALYFESLETRVGSLLEADPTGAHDAVLRSVELKAAVVGADEHETDYRQILNFGHTLGHALEAASRYAVAHGTAVAAGMLLEAEIGERLGVTESGTAERLERGLAALDLPRLPELDLDRVADYLRADKKARGGRAKFVLLEKVGETHRAEGWSHDVPEALVREVLHGGLSIL